MGRMKAMRPILSGQAIKELDRRAEGFGMSSLLLMESAGRGAAEVIRQAFPQAAQARVVALAGKGGNGGDALCAARWLGLWGAEPLAIVLGEPAGAAAEQARAFSACFPERLVRIEKEEDLASWQGEISRADLVIDGILGVGVRGPARGLAKAAIELLEDTLAPIVAIDLPSGLSADSGEVPGPAVRAELTLAMGALKPCHLLPPAAEHAGEVRVVEVAYPPSAWEEVEPVAWVLSDDCCARWLPPRPRFGHKGTFGRVLVVGGAVGMAGAVSLAAEAALLISTAPIWAMLINALLGWEKLSGRQIAGTIIGFAGIAGVIMGGLRAREVPEHHALGLLIMVVAGILWASYAVFSRPLLQHYSPLKVTTWIHTIGAVVLIPVGAGAAMKVDWVGMSPLSWLCLLHFSLLAGVYAFVVWYRGVSTIGSSRTVLFQYCVPIVATLAAYFLLHEVPTVIQVLGIAVTLVGLQLAVPQHHGVQAVTDVPGE